MILCSRSIRKFQLLILETQNLVIMCEKHVTVIQPCHALPLDSCLGDYKLYRMCAQAEARTLKQRHS
jgi:hypothetical protein